MLRFLLSHLSPLASRQSPMSLPLKLDDIIKKLIALRLMTCSLHFFFIRSTILSCAVVCVSLIRLFILMLGEKTLDYVARWWWRSRRVRAQVKLTFIKAKKLRRWRSKVIINEQRDISQKAKRKWNIKSCCNNSILSLPVLNKLFPWQSLTINYDAFFCVCFITNAIRDVSGVEFYHAVPNCKFHRQAIVRKM